MARSFSSADAKKLLKTHKDILRQLGDGADSVDKYGFDIKKKSEDLVSRDIFMSHARKELINEIEIQSIEINELFRLLFLYKFILPHSIDCQKILSENRERISKAIDELSAGSNGVSWLFSSAKKKNAAESAYDLLSNELNGQYFENAIEILKNINELNHTALSSVLDDFRQNISQYEWNLKNHASDALKKGSSIPEITKLLARYSGIRQKLADAKQTIELSKDEIKKAAEKMVMQTALDVLKTVPVEEVNRDKKGIRVKALRDAGYCNMADIFAASVYQLASVYGISEDAAYTIKNTANQFAVDARKNIKIKLSFDNQTKESTKLVLAVFGYRKRLDSISKIIDFENSYNDKINSAITDIESIKNGISWLFFSQDRKQSVTQSYRYLTDQLNGDYEKTALILAKELYQISEIPIDNAWSDFKINSIAYFNILEEIVPGVLGNDDKLYGLPEDLAREIQDECFFPDGLKCELRRYQEWGVKYILHQEKVRLGDEMGLGKTIQAIATMVSLKNVGAIHFIVVCPASVLPNWCKEISEKSKLRVIKVHGTGRNMAFKSWIQTGGVAVTTYETTGIFKIEDNFEFDLLVVDEAHFIKNTGAARSQNVRNLCKFSKRLLFMTGTALENNVDEMISLINVLQHSIACQIKNIAFMSSAPQFREKIAPVYYRRKREEVLTELPDLIEIKEWCDMSEKEERIYEQTILEKNHMRIRQLSWNVDDIRDSCKAKRMLEIIEEAEAEGRKILVFSFFLDTIRKICGFLGDRCLNPINGSLNPQRRQEIIDEFDKAPAGKVLCAQIQSGGTGLNIQSASVVIICEPQFKPSIENQAISRAYRMGQARNVLVYRLLCENTVDERITKMLEEKQAIFDAFADKSVAAEKTMKTNAEVDDTSFGKIIEEEINRIKEKNGIK